MQFIGRKRELHLLTNAWKKEDAFIVVDGRSKVGKTAFVKQFIHKKNHLYFSAGNVTDRLNQVRFAKIVKDKLGVDVMPASAKTAWEDLFRFYAEKTEDGGKILVIDHFDNLVYNNDSFLNTFKKAWQQLFRPNGVTVIIVVPNGSGKRAVLGDKGLMSEVTCRIDLAPVSFVEMMREFPHHDFSGLMLMYAVTGGVPAYWYIFDHCINDKQVRETIETNILSAHGIFFEEANNLFEREVWEPSLYHAILSGIAQEKATLDDLTLYTGVKTGRVRDGLDNLMALGYIEETTSVGKKKFFEKDRVAYRIADPMLDFWYTFVFPYYDAIKQGVAKGARENLKRTFSQYIQKWFKQVSSEIFLLASRHGAIGIKVSEVGEYFDDSDSIDMVAVDEENKKVFFGDCVFGSEPYTKKKFDYFKEKIAGIKRIKKTYKDYTYVYGIFSATPFEQELLDYSLATENVLLFNGITVYSLDNKQA